MSEPLPFLFKALFIILLPCTSVRKQSLSPSNFLIATERLLLRPSKLSLCSWTRPVSSAFPHRTCALSPYPSWWPLLASLKFINVSLILGVQSWMHYSRCDLMTVEERSITFQLAMLLMIRSSVLYSGHS